MKLTLAILLLLLLSCTHTYRATAELLLFEPGYGEELIKKITGADTVWLDGLEGQHAIYKYKR